MIDEKRMIEELKESGFIIDDDFGNELVGFIDAQPKTGGDQQPHETGNQLYGLWDMRRSRNE